MSLKSSVSILVALLFIVTILSFTPSISASYTWYVVDSDDVSSTGDEVYLLGGALDGTRFAYFFMGGDNDSRTFYLDFGCKYEISKISTRSSYYDNTVSNFSVYYKENSTDSWTLLTYITSLLDHSGNWNDTAITQTTIRYMKWVALNYSGYLFPQWGCYTGVGDNYDTILRLYREPGTPTWSVEPYALTSSSLTMTASPNSPNLEYYFDETTGNPGGTDSGWQSSPSYTDSGLSENTQYTYRVAVREGTATSGYSSSKSCYTLLEPPTYSELTLGTAITTSTMSMSVTAPPNSAAGSTGSYFYAYSPASGETSSGWLTGTYTYQDIGLDSNSPYTYQVRYRNGDGIATNYALDKTKYTLAPAPTDFRIDEVGVEFVVMSVSAPNYPTSGSTGAYFDWTGGLTFDSGWTTYGYATGRYYYIAENLTENTTYTFRVKLRNGDSTDTAYSSTDSDTTLVRFETLNASYISSTTARLNAQINEFTGTAGFWYGTTPVNDSSYDTNTTVDTYDDETDTIHIDPSLNDSTYYYFNAWILNTTGFYSDVQHYFLTKPSGPPTLLAEESFGMDYINLTWVNRTVNTANWSTVIRASTTTYPTLTSGTEIYNGTGSFYNYTSLESDTTYYFSAWTYINSSGSPLLHQFSSSAIYAEETTESGLYTFYLRWENVTYNLLDLDHGENGSNEHDFIVHYGYGVGAIEYNEYDESSGSWTLTQTPDFTDADTSDGFWTINVTYRPLWIEFSWREKMSWWAFWAQDFYCHRTLVLDPEEKNYTIYVRTDLHYIPAILGSVVEWLNKTSLVEYNYHFIDNNGHFSLDDHPYAYIYKYDQDGNQLIIHSQYLDKNMEIQPSLVSGDTYYLGIKSDTAEIPYLGKAPTGSSLSIDIDIPKSLALDYLFFDYITLNTGWYTTGPGGIFVNYVDTTYTTVEANVTFYNLTGSIVYQTNSTLDSSNLTFSTLNGCNLSQPYIYQINITLQASGILTTGLLILYPQEDYTLTSVTDIDTLLTTFLGETPLVNSEGVGVSYAYIIVLILAILGLLTFKPEAAHVGLFVEGMIFVLSAGAISGLNNLFSNYSWQQGVVLGTIGAFLIILGLWASLSGKRKEVSK